jgi:hypothetical protein
VNALATLVARVRLTYLNNAQRAAAGAVDIGVLLDAAPQQPPEFPYRDQWYHPRTLQELSSILGYVASVSDPALQRFLRVVFSSILTSTTGRRGEQHSYFADNTPLGSGQSAPPYVDAVRAFISRLERSLSVLERLYASIERDGRNPEVELARATVYQQDARTAQPSDYGVEPQSVAGVITSPPYLGMADYSLGNRLSYYWLNLGSLENDYEREIGARRKRFRRSGVLDQYVSDMAGFAEASAAVIRPGGYLAVVLGQPSARAFASSDVVTAAEEAIQGVGFKSFWRTERRVQWNRNYGYHKLSSESIRVFVRE